LLQGLSHPLLLADYKAKRQKLEHQAMMSGNAAAATAGSKKGAGRLLGTHKVVMARWVRSGGVGHVLRVKKQTRGFTVHQ
jgi:hypothetical protein